MNGQPPLFDARGRHVLVVSPEHAAVQAWALRLGHAGAKLMLGGTDPDRLEALAERFQAQGVDTRWAVAHAHRPEPAMTQWAAQVHQRMGDVDVLVTPEGITWYASGLPQSAGSSAQG